MEFLVRIALAVPEEVPAADVEDLRRREATRAAELAAAGELVRLWRVPGEWANWGLWNAADEAALTETLASLPLRPYMEVELVALEPHPSDPASPNEGAATPPVVPAGEVPFSVLVVRRAAARGVDLATVDGTGLGGLVRLVDVERARPTLPPRQLDRPSVPKIPALVPLPSLALPHDQVPRVAPAEVAGRHNAGQSPANGHLTSVIEVDTTVVAEVGAGVNGGSFLPVLAAACVRALVTHPELNASSSGDAAADRPGGVDLNVAIDTALGVATPVVHGAEGLSYAALAQALDDLTARARAGVVTATDDADGTFTVVDSSRRGTLADTPAVGRQQVAALTAGTPVRRPVVVRTSTDDESVSIRSMTLLTLAYDGSRAAAAEAAGFLVAVKTLLEDQDFVRHLIGADGKKG